MSKSAHAQSIVASKISQKIYFLRGHRVMLSTDLARLYGVEVRALIQAVQRNIERFPADFLFQLTADEHKNLKSQFVISSWGGARTAPYAFTEQGVAMLSSVLKSGRAVEVNIAIMRTFVQLRRMLLSNEELNRKISALEQKYDENFRVVFAALRKLLAAPERPRRRIGFTTDEES